MNATSGWAKSASEGGIVGLVHESKPLRFGVYVERDAGAWELLETAETEFKAAQVAEKLCKKHDARARVFDREAGGFEH